MNTLTGNAPKVSVNGMESVMVRYAPCCHPLPGDTIIGFLTNGRGIAVHRRDCAHAKIFAHDRERSVVLTWHDENVADMKSKITIQGTDRVGLISAVTDLIEKKGVNITELHCSTAGQRAKITVELEVKSLNQLKKLKRDLVHINGISRVTRDEL